MEKPTGHLILWEGATLIQVKSHYTQFPGSAKGGGRRGKCNGFSASSRKRMMLLLNRVQESALRKSILITLTYHRNEITTENIKQNFKAFRESLRRNYPDGSGIWKLEYQKRGSPHYHILWIGKRIPHTWISRRWNEIAEPGDIDHLRAGTRIERVSKAKSAHKYLTKYLGKVDDGPQGSIRNGIRHWGVINRAKLPVGRRRIVPCSGNAAREIIEQTFQQNNWPFAGSENVGSVDIFEGSSGSAVARFERFKARPDTLEEWRSNEHNNG